MAGTRTEAEQVEASAGERDGESVPCSLLSYEYVDDVTLPAVDVSGTKFVAIRLAKGGLLFRYSDCAVPSLASKHRWQRIRRMTSAEANLLNAAKKDCHNRHAKNPYVVGDIMVDIDSFRLFYDIVRDCVALATPHPGALQEGGWLQINNSVCPYVWRSDIRHVPQIIVTLAAEVSLDDDGKEARSGDSSRLSVVRVTPSEMAFLNDLCTKANQDFRFDGDTDLVSLVDVKLASDAIIFELPPTENPFQHCVYLGRMDAETVATARMVMKTAWSHLHDAGKSPAPDKMDVAPGDPDTERGDPDTGKATVSPSVADPPCSTAGSRVASSDTNTAPLIDRAGSDCFSDADSVIVLSPGDTNEGGSDESCAAALPSGRPTAVDLEELSAGGGEKPMEEAAHQAPHRPSDARSPPSPALDLSIRHHRAPGPSKSRHESAGGGGVAPSERCRDGDSSHRLPATAATTIGSRRCEMGLRTSEGAGAPFGKLASPSPDSGFASPLQSPAERRATTEFPLVTTAASTVRRQTSQTLTELLTDNNEASMLQEQSPSQVLRTTSGESQPVEAGATLNQASPPLLAQLLHGEASTAQEQPTQEQLLQASSGQQFTPDFRQPPPYVPPSKPATASARNDAIALALQLAAKYPMLASIVHDRHAAGMICDAEVLRMLTWFVHVQQQLFIVIRQQRNIVQELRGYDTVLVAECDLVLRDMLNSLKFWLSRQHDLPPRMRAVLHHTLSCAVLQRPVQSHLNYLIGGLFVVEPAAAAENFTFLRNAVALAIVAQGAQQQQQQHPTAAYVVAERCKAHLMRRMSAWSSLRLPDNGAFNQENPQSWCDALTRAYSQVYSFVANGAGGKSGSGRDVAFVESEAQQPSQLLLLQHAPTVLLLQRKLLQQQLMNKASGHTNATPLQLPPNPPRQTMFGSTSPEWQQQQQDVSVATHVLPAVAAATTTRSTNLPVSITSLNRLVSDGASAAEAAAAAFASVASPTTRSTATPHEFDRVKRRMVCSPGTATTVAMPGAYQEATANADEYSLTASRRRTPVTVDRRMSIATSQQSQEVGMNSAAAPQTQAMRHEVATDAASSSANECEAVYFRLPPTIMPVLPAITRRGFGNEQWMLVSDAARAFFPHCTVDEFQLVLEEILHIDLVPASSDDLSALDVARSATGQLAEAGAVAAVHGEGTLLLVSCRALAEHSSQLRDLLNPSA